MFKKPLNKLDDYGSKIKALGEVKRSNNGDLDIEFIIKVLDIADYHAKSQFVIRKSELIEERRHIFKTGN